MTVTHTIRPIIDYPTWRDDVTHLHEACFPDCEVYGTDTPDSFWWLVFFGNEDTDPVGFAGLRADYASKQGYLCRSGILPGHRGCGLQFQLIKARVAKARKLHLTSLVTDTIPGNYHSANNLIRAGFKLFNPATPWAGVDGSLFWRMELHYP